MSRWDIQQNAMVGCEEMRGSVSVPLSLSDLKGPVVCPKPRRFGFLANHPTMSLRWCKRSIHGELDSKAGAELLDMILTKDGYGVEQKEVASSPPPFFTGSPPTRVSNPIVQDANFRDGKLSPLSTLQILPSSGSPSPLSPFAPKGGCARMKFGLKPAAVRVEGFDCLSRDRQNSGITAVA